jgi:hypothetical protein
MRFAAAVQHMLEEVADTALPRGIEPRSHASKQLEHRTMRVRKPYANDLEARIQSSGDELRGFDV